MLVGSTECRASEKWRLKQLVLLPAEVWLYSPCHVSTTANWGKRWRNVDAVISYGRVITLCIPWHGVIFVCLGVWHHGYTVFKSETNRSGGVEVMCNLQLVVCESHPFCYFKCCDHFLWFWCRKYFFLIYHTHMCTHQPWQASLCLQLYLGRHWICWRRRCLCRKE